MAMFIDADKSRIRTHLEYPDIELGAVSVGGVAFGMAPQNKLEFVMNNMTTNGITRTQVILGYLETIETQQLDALSRLQASKADVVTLNPEELAALLTQYRYWQTKLANQMTVSVNPFAEKSGIGINVRLARQR